jgi:hypothetical protein
MQLRSREIQAADVVHAGGQPEESLGTKNPAQPTFE